MYVSAHLNHRPPHFLPALPHPHAHVCQQCRVADVGRVAVAVDVACPFVFRGVGVAGPDVAGLELFELLLRAEFVGLLVVSGGKVMRVCGWEC